MKKIFSNKKSTRQNFKANFSFTKLYDLLLGKKREEFARSAGPNKSQTNNDRKVSFALNYYCCCFNLKYRERKKKQNQSNQMKN